MKNIHLNLRKPISMAILILLCAMQWACIEEMEPREPRSIRPVERPKVTPGTRDPNANQRSKRDPIEKRIRG
jgi:hypothetical protein